MTEADPSATGAAEPALVLVSGFVATGKSTLSRALAERLGAVRLEADRVRGTLLEASEAAESSESGAEARWRRDLAPSFEDDIYADLMRRAASALEAGGPVVLDACFPRRAQRRAARALAARFGVPFLFVECHVPESEIRERLAERDRRAGRAGWVLIFERLASSFEPPEEIAPEEHLVVRTDRPPELALEAVMDRLSRLEPPRRPAPRGVRLAPPPRVVSFDCWSTLLAEDDWPWAHALRVSALREAAREAGREVAPEEAEEAFRAAWQRHILVWQAGRSSGAAEVAGWGLEALGIADAHPAVEHLVRRFEEASHTGNVVALDGAPQLLQGLASAGIPCVLVCDTGLTPGRVVRQLLERAGLLRHLSVQAFSDEVGVPKPDARIFRAALDPLGADPEDVVHVGDLRRTDVAGGRALGMRTVRIRARHDDTSDDHPDADHVVDSHAALADLLDVDGVELEG